MADITTTAVITVVDTRIKADSTMAGIIIRAAALNTGIECSGTGSDASVGAVGHLQSGIWLKFWRGASGARTKTNAAGGYAK